MERENINKETQAVEDAKALSRWFPQIRNSKDFIRTSIVFLLPIFIGGIILQNIFGFVGTILGVIIGFLVAFYYSSPRLVGKRAIDEALRKKK